MAHGLLDGTDTLHMYRHDVESLFYVILILATHYEIQTPSEAEDGGIRMRQGLGELPYQAWFDQPSYKALGAFKQAFLSNFEPLDLSPTFEGLRSWLVKLRAAFSRGYRTKQHYQSLLQGEEDQAEEPVAFNDETLGGNVDYFALINPVLNPKGKLKELTISYPPNNLRPRPAPLKLTFELVPLDTTPSNTVLPPT